MADESRNGPDLRREIERLREVEQRFEDFIESARDFAFITLDADNGITGWSAGAEQLLGFTEAEVKGQSGALLFTPEDRAARAPEQELATAATSGRAQDERWHVRKDGSRFWGSGVLRRLCNAQGQIRGYTKILRDHTEQRLYLEALLASEERFRLLVENLRDCALFSTDLTGSISDWNSGAERIFGHTAAEVLGLSAVDLLAADDEARETLKGDLELARSRGGAAAEAWLVRKGGSHFYARWVSNAMCDTAGRLIGFTKVLRDETDRKRAHEERERHLERERERLEGEVHFTNSALDRTREELQDVAGQLLRAQDEERRRMARDLHDQFAQRLAFVEIKARDLWDSLPDHLHEAKAKLEVIEKHVLTLSEDVRDLSHRLHPSTLEHIGLVAALSSLADDFSTRRSQPIELDVSDFFEEGLPTDFASALYRIAEEALRNVQRHTPNAPVRVSLFRSPEAVHLQITDKGHGFSPDAISTGHTLGLISMAERARLIGGTLDLRSAPGAGTTVRVDVPVPEMQQLAAGA